MTHETYKRAHNILKLRAGGGGGGLVFEIWI